MGAFEKGIRQDLVGRLLNVDKVDNLDKFVVLAKAFSSGKASKNGNPIIIDTAGIFGSPRSELNTNVHDVQGGGPSVAKTIDTLVRKIDEEFEMKKAETGSPSLTESEVDSVISNVMKSVTLNLLLPTPFLPF